MTSLNSITIEATDPTAAEQFYADAFALGTLVSRKVDQLVLLLGAEDVGASKRFYVERGLAVGKRFYVERGLAVGKSFGSYVEFATPSSPIGLGLYKRRALAKDAGVAPEGTGSHRLVIGGDAGEFTDPDGFAWEAAS